MSHTPTDDHQIPELPEKPKSSTGKYVAIGAGALVVVLAAGFGIKAATSDGSSDKLTTIKVGTTENAEPYWTQLQKVGKEKYGLDIKPVSFTDYTQANPALAQGQLDLNQFQHLEFLADYNVSNHQDLTPVGSTYVVPLAIYSKKHTKTSQISKGGKVAIPNDPTNEARALLLLQKAGLLKLKGGGSPLSTPADIDTANSTVGVTPVDAAQTASVMSSVEASVVNNNFAADNNLNPAQALLTDDPKAKNAEPYINVVVAQKKDANKPAYAKFVQAFHDPSVEALIRKQTKNTTVLVRRPQSDLTLILTKLEGQIKDKK